MNCDPHMHTTTSQKHRVRHLRVHSSQKKYCIFYANNLLIAKCTRPTSHTSNTVDKLNKFKLSGLVNVFTMVRQLVCWWWWCCCLFVHQCTMVSSTMVVAVAVVAARWQRQLRRWRRWTTIGGESGRHREHRRLHDSMR
jgi:hypothetical protein